MKKTKKISKFQVVLILISFVAAVGIVFCLIHLANHVINDQLQLTGWTKTFSQIIAIIISLYPVKFTFGRIVYKVYGDVNANKSY